jgi:hypothetical protein
MITAWNKLYNGFLRMRDIRAGRLKHATSFFQRPGWFALGFVLRISIKYTVPFFLLGDYLGSVLLAP